MWLVPQYFQHIFLTRGQFTCSFVKVGYSFGIFLNSANLICRSTDISKCFREFLRLRDNESRLYMELGRKSLTVFSTAKNAEFLDESFLSQEPLLRSVYCVLRDDADQGIMYNNPGWASHIKSLLDQLGFSGFEINSSK